MRYALGDTTDTSSTDTSTSSGGNWLQTLVTSYAQAKLTQEQLSAAQQINAINITRAQQGLPPISVPDIAGPTVNVGLSPATMQLLEYAIFGVIGLFAVNMLTGRRRG